MLSASGILAEHVAVMVAVAVYDEFGCEIAIGLSVHPEHSLVPLDPGIDKQRLPLQRLRNGVAAPKPAVDPLSLKYRPVLTVGEAAFLRHAVVTSVGEKRLHLHCVHHRKQLGFQHFLISL